MNWRSTGLTMDYSTLCMRLISTDSSLLRLSHQSLPDRQLLRNRLSRHHGTLPSIRRTSARRASTSCVFGPTCYSPVDGREVLLGIDARVVLQYEEEGGLVPPERKSMV